MHLYRVQQISDAHCGPAVLQMLLNSIGIYCTQEEITRQAGAENTIDDFGTRVDQLAKACKRLAPQTQFWYKFRATLDDIRVILSRGYGVGIEWQGLFYQSEEEEAQKSDKGEGEYGHYSIISFIDEDRQVLIIVDPYKDFANQDRIITVKTFLRRWYDINEIVDPYTGQKRMVEDQQLLFFVTPQNEAFLPELGFQKA